jgi:AraC family transcriptional regulator
MSFDCSFDRIDSRTGKGVNLGTSVCRGPYEWPGLAVREVWCDGPGETAEGYAVNHLLTILLDEPVQTEIRWSGTRMIARLPFGGISITPAGMPFSRKWDRAAKGLVLQVDQEFLTSIAGGTSRGKLDLCPGHCVIDPVIFNLSISLVTEGAKQRPYGTAYGEAIAMALGAQLVRHYSQTSNKAIFPRFRRTDFGKQTLSRVLDYLNINLGEDITISRLARLADMEPYQFVRSFKRTMGVTPHRYIVENRIEIAKRQLRTSERSITDLALELGFATPNHFSSVFRKLVGTSPRLYRRSLKE